MWPLVSPPGVFKARIRAGRVRRRTSDMRDGHPGLCGGDETRPRSHLRQGDKIQTQTGSGGRGLSSSSHGGHCKKKKEKRKEEEGAAFAGQLGGSGPRTLRGCLCASPQLEDEPGRRRGAAARVQLVQLRRGLRGLKRAVALTHTHTASTPALSHVRTMGPRRPGVRAQGPRALWFSHSGAAPPTHSVWRRLRVAGRSCALPEKEEAVLSLQDEDPRRYPNPLASLLMSSPFNSYRVLF